MPEERLVLGREIGTEVRASALTALERGGGDQAR